MAEAGGDGDDGRLARALAAIDAANAEDPTRITVDGREVPKEPLHAEMMTDWVRRLDPGADELQLIAARAHHLRRWETPRSDHPEGRAGYLRWRSAARRRHAELVGGIMEDAGYGAEEVERVRAIVRKQGLRDDPAVQVHEDALCLVFLQTQLGELTEQVGEEEMVRILATTLPKMSPAGVAAAGGLDLGERGRQLLDDAVRRAAASSP